MLYSPLFLLLVLVTVVKAGLWDGFRDTVGASGERLVVPPSPDVYAPIIYNTVSSKEHLVGGPYAGSNVSMGGFVTKTGAGLLAGMNIVADFNVTGNLSINFNLDNDPALSLTCANGQTFMKATSVPGSCKRRVGINLLNPQCTLDVDDTICINGVPINTNTTGPYIPIAWYYQIDESPCISTAIQQYFTPSAIDQAAARAVDTVFVGYQGGAIAFATDNTTASYGDCRGAHAVDFQYSRSLSSQVASGPGSFIAASQSCTASNTASSAISSLSSVASAIGSVVIACGTCTNSGTRSLLLGTSNTNSGAQSIVFGNTITSASPNSLISGAGHSTTALQRTLIASGMSHSLDAASIVNGGIFAGIGLKTTVNTTFSCGASTECPMAIFGRYNAPDDIGITTAPRVFAIGDGTSDSSRSNLFSILSNGDVHTKLGGTYITGGADFQEYFEHELGPVKLPIGTTVKITEEGMIRKAQPGEHPDGVVSRRGGVLGNSDNFEWVGKYEMDDDTGKIKVDKNGQKVLSKHYDPKRRYISREERPEWHTIGLVGQCEVLDGSVVSPNWVPMPRKPKARPGTKWYLIK